MAWKPDRDALFIDAFSFNWKEYYFYAFPPFALISRVLQKAKMEKPTGIIILLMWPTQPWYTSLFTLTIATPRLLQKGERVLQMPQMPNLVHPLHQAMQLLACLISGKDSETKRFQKTPLTSSWLPGEMQTKNSTILTRQNGQNFATQGKLINVIPL